MSSDIKKPAEDVIFGDSNQSKLIFKGFCRETNCLQVIRGMEVAKTGVHLTTIVSQFLDSEDSSAEKIPVLESSSTCFIPGVKILDQVVEGVGVTARFLVPL